MPRIKIYVSLEDGSETVGRQSHTEHHIDINDGTWNALQEDEREIFLRDEMMELITWNWEEVK